MKTFYQKLFPSKLGVEVTLLTGGRTKIIVQGICASMTAMEWLLLDNLKNGWPFDVNMTKEQAARAMKFCREKDWVGHSGRMTDAGRIAFLIQPIQKENP